MMKEGGSLWGGSNPLGGRVFPLRNLVDALIGATLHSVILSGHGPSPWGRPGRRISGGAGNFPEEPVILPGGQSSLPLFQHSGTYVGSSLVMCAAEV